MSAIQKEIELFQNLKHLQIESAYKEKTKHVIIYSLIEQIEESHWLKRLIYLPLATY